MAYKNILIEKEEGIALLTINRPQALNALNKEIFWELGQAIEEIALDPEARVIILTGSGEKAFVAGTDIGEMQHLSPPEARDYAQFARKAIDKLESLGKPVIAAINGFALGGGFELALACDLRIASDKAKFGQPEINLGIIPGSGATQRLPRLIGLAKAKELILTGEVIDAQTALALGLVNKVVASESLREEAKSLARKLASKGAIALAQAKAVLNRGLDLELAKGLDLEIEHFSRCFATQDQKEGFSAFLEKRKPKFSGK